MAKIHHLAFWNLENLFAPEGHPERVPWIAERMKRELAGWTEALFARKIARLTEAIAALNEGRGPDLLGVCEVENRFVLEALAEALDAALPHRRHALVHADAQKDRRGIDTAFVYDAACFEVDPATVFSHWVLRRTGTRDITQATFKTAAGNELVALANHWPSRSGGAYESRGFRMTAGETLGYWHERIWEEKGDRIAVLAMGDFNDEPFDASLTIHARATRERDDLIRARTPRFFNLAWRSFVQRVPADRRGRPRRLQGTLYYQGDANVFDQILVGRNLLRRDGPLRVLEETAQIEAHAPMIDHRASPAPIRFGLPKGDAARNVNEDGFSDHYPVSVRVEED